MSKHTTSLKEKRPKILLTLMTPREGSWWVIHEPISERDSLAVRLDSLRCVFNGQRRYGIGYRSPTVYTAGDSMFNFSVCLHRPSSWPAHPKLECVNRARPPPSSAMRLAPWSRPRYRGYTTTVTPKVFVSIQMYIYLCIFLLELGGSRVGQNLWLWDNKNVILFSPI